MDITHADYQVHYDEAAAIVTCQGSFRLRDAEAYQPILNLLTRAAAAKPVVLTLDVRALRFLNSAGINTLAKFILLMRQHTSSVVLIKGSRQHPWQKKSLTNYQRLLPTVQLEIA